MAKRALITGVTGQDGSYLAELLIEKGYEVHGVVRRSSSINRTRIDHLRDAKVPLILHYGDLTDASSINRLLRAVRPDGARPVRPVRAVWCPERPRNRSPRAVGCR